MAVTASLIVGAMLPITERNDEEIRQKTAIDRLEQIGQALERYYIAKGALPELAGNLSWRVSLLPFLGEEGLYKEFALDEPWDSSQNHRLLVKMPKVYESPGVVVERFTTFFQVFDGSGTAFRPIMGGVQYPGAKQGDWTERVVLVVEADQPVPWSKPADIPFEYGKPSPQPGGVFRGATLFSGYAKLNGAHALLANGTVRFFPRMGRPPGRGFWNGLEGEEPAHVAPFWEGNDW